MCCVRGGHVAAGVAARRQMIRPEERVLIIPVEYRSNNSPFHIIAFGAVGVFIVLSVLGLQIQIGSKLIYHTDQVVFGAYLPQSRGLLVIVVRFHTGLGLFFYIPFGAPL